MEPSTQWYERLASALVASPLEQPARMLRRLKDLPGRLQHPELREIHLEDARIARFMRSTISDAMNCVDVGCHLGSLLGHIVRLAPNGRHAAVEPVPYKAAWLRKKFPAVAIHQVALGDSTGTAEFFYRRRSSAKSALRLTEEAADVETFMVDRETLDRIVPAGRRIGFIKIDVEGAEYLVLRGARRMLGESHPVILFECTGTGLRAFGYSASQIYRLLTAELGYEVFFLKDRLADGPALDLHRFEASMVFPFQAFNYVAAPARS